MRTRYLVRLLIFVSLVQFCKIENSMAQNADLKFRCGFSSRSELIQTAEDIILRFSRLNIQDLRLHSVTEDSLSSQPPPPAIVEIVSSNLNALISNPSLVVPQSAGMATVVFGDGNGVCHGLPCAWPGTFSILLPPSWLSQFAVSAKDKFADGLLIIIGHEIGHHVYDSIFKVDATYPRVSVDGPITPLRYHLTVDAIGSLLAGKTLDDVVNALKLSLVNSAVEGDGPARIQCLTGLPD